MRRPYEFVLVGIGIVLAAAIGFARQAPAARPYKVLQTAKVGGLGGFDYIYADADGRQAVTSRAAAWPTTRHRCRHGSACLNLNIARAGRRDS